MNEFELINHFFIDKQDHNRSDVVLGIGDDCAILEIPKGHQLVLSMDTLIEGVHFPKATQPFDVGYKALAVNMSDLAAMGATPAWITLALTLPSVDKEWLSAFSEGLFSLARQFNVQLIGGDTTRGPLSITIQAHGFVSMDAGVRRCGAKPGDLIYVTNTLGDAGLALSHIKQERILSSDVFEAVALKLNRPLPRIKESVLLAKMATSMIDVSDGLIADLGHILKASQVGAVLSLAQIPLSVALKQSVKRSDALTFALSAGDDYELCFTIPKCQQQAFEGIMSAKGCMITHIGQITAERALCFIDSDKECFADLLLNGYTHF